MGGNVNLFLKKLYLNGGKIEHNIKKKAFDFYFDFRRSSTVTNSD